MVNRSSLKTVEVIVHTKMIDLFTLMSYKVCSSFFFHYKKDLISNLESYSKHN